MQKTEIMNIKFDKEIDNMSFLSKNLYNYANYIIRQEFIKNKKWIRYSELNVLCKENENYKSLPAQTSQQCLRLLDKNWMSFFKSIKDWVKHPEKYKGRPKLPKYKDKIKGRNILIYPFQNLSVKENEIKIPKTSFIIKIRDKIKDSKINQLRIIPNQSNYKVEVIYEIQEKELNQEIKRVLSLDLGVNNFVTSYNNIGLNPFIVNGRIMKSLNQFYNKIKSLITSELKVTNNKDWSTKLSSLTEKRNNRIKDSLHKVSKFIVGYCIENQIDAVIIGHNKQWKNEVNIGKVNNQNFVNIPHSMFIKMMSYKLKEQGIKLIETEESYTSKVDHLAYEEMKHQEKYLGKRKKRGLFQSSTGKLINSDVNGALGIMRKVIGDSVITQILDSGLGFNPVFVNI